MSAAFFRGTGIDQNVKFKDKDKQLIRETDWPPEFEKQVDLSKVSISFHSKKDDFKCLNLVPYNSI